MNDFVHKVFKKIKITNKQNKKFSEINGLMERRRKLKKKETLNEKEDDELNKIEESIAEKCEEANRKRVNDNFKDIGGNEGNLSHQGIWSVKKKN